MKFRNIVYGVVALLFVVVGVGMLPAHAVDLMSILPGLDLTAASAVAFGIGNVASPEVKEAIDRQIKAWEDYKAMNEARLKEIEVKGHASADVLEKISKIDEVLTKTAAEIKAERERADRLEIRLNRPGAGASGKGLTEEQMESKAALDDFLRKGEDAPLRAIHRKAMTSQSSPDGGLLVTPEFDSTIDRVVSVVTSFRSIARTVKIGTDRYERLVKTRGLSGGWRGESASGSESTTAQWSKIEIPVHTMYALAKTPNSTLEDSMIDLEMDIADEAAITFREVEGTSFISGNGVGQPRGFLAESLVPDANYEWKKVGYVATGNSGAFDTTNPADDVITLMHKLKSVYRAGAVFLMADSTLSIMRQFKDGSGNFYLWNPDPSGGPSGTFLGAPVVIDDYMPVIGANSYSVAYGNFQRGYTIVDRRGTFIIRDIYTEKGTTVFDLSRRVGGGVTNYEAIKLLKFGTS